uniref:Uncharacterized protein n=1 Tax=Cucumis melo TaxID=3656 RepID=A0A9I9EBT6_CUCME
ARFPIFVNLWEYGRSALTSANTDQLAFGGSPISTTLQRIDMGEMLVCVPRVNKKAKKFRKSGCPHYEKLVRIFRDTTTTGVNACPSTRLISYSEDENENDVASNINIGVEENEKEKAKNKFEEMKTNLTVSSHHS